ncbi:hypothetical protein U1Q18_002368, partial [Sarracenia purpurea var. burkii]
FGRSSLTLRLSLWLLARVFSSPTRLEVCDRFVDSSFSVHGSSSTRASSAHRQLVLHRHSSFVHHRFGSLIILHPIVDNRRQQSISRFVSLCVVGHPSFFLC